MGEVKEKSGGNGARAKKRVDNSKKEVLVNSTKFENDPRLGQHRSREEQEHFYWNAKSRIR